MSETVNDLYECLSLEIIIEKGKNIIVTCLYRTPGTNIDDFVEKMEILLNKVKNNKSVILCGDFNIDLLKSEVHIGTKKYLDLLNSFGLYPVINYPTRVAAGSATLIDNIFTNIIDSSKNGIIINDNISDHLPIFSMINYKGIVKQDNQKYIIKRLVNENRLDKFKDDLLKINWENLHSYENVDTAYDNFISKIIELYDKHCPLKQIKLNSIYREKPWITNSLKNCCHKKNELYKKYVKNRNLVNESKYKNYKNRLTSLLCFSEKYYYNELFKNIKMTQKILGKFLM